MSLIVAIYKILSVICVIFLSVVLLVIIYRILKIGLLWLLDKLK